MHLREADGFSVLRTLLLFHDLKSDDVARHGLTHMLLSGHSPCCSINANTLDQATCTASLQHLEGSTCLVTDCRLV